MNKTVFFLFSFFPFFIAMAAHAMEDTYYDARENGWHWYDDPIEKAVDDTPTTLSSPASNITATEEMKALQKRFEETKNKAVLYPTEENIKDFVVMQNEFMHHSRDFAKNWQAMLLNHPELNFQVSHPTNQVGREVYLDQKSLKEDEIIEAFFKDKGLYFFFRSTCPYCQRFAPILKSFAERYHITLLPISLDGRPLPEFPEFKTDHGQAQKFAVTVEPSLFVVDPKIGKAIPVAYGLLSRDALRERLYDIATQFHGEF